MIYRFRIILDTKEDVFRDIEIKADNTLEDFHNVITQSFGFEGQEMASFYASDDDWNQGEEYALFDLSDGIDTIKIMNETSIEDAVYEQRNRLIYVYDFFNLWTFMVELVDIVEDEEGVDYPNLLFAVGNVPDEAPEKEFIAEKNENSEDFFDDDFNSENYNDLDFDEHWN
ncbi:MAG: IS1096 element passenger TnpR family protein [Flavobacteriales bacterium]